MKYKKIQSLWQKIYPDNDQEQLSGLLADIDRFTAECNLPHHEPAWYKEVVVYSLYVDLFNKDFRGLDEKLDYLADLGISCLWLLPILDSPMRDGGFDIRDFRKIRNELLPGVDQAEAFSAFITKAHDRGIRIIFDIALNHTSDEHPWFVESAKSEKNPFRDFYIWHHDDQKYKEARIIFQGIERSNWTKKGDAFYFHRFFDFQPDLNYRNPAVLVGMCRNLLYWLRLGVDGFRADAIPYLWKEDGTSCENLNTTHDIVKFFRAVLEVARPHTLLLAEACQKPHEVVRYFGDGNECNAGYHFPLMPQLFKSIAMGDAKPITDILDPDNTPAIPDTAQWFTFLRCHDELSLELVYVSEEDRAYIHERYCHDPVWDFREGQGISARLAELLEGDPRKIALAFSLMLTLPGTPVIYYGDEFSKMNDTGYYRQQVQMTGKDDSRYLNRGKIDWDELKTLLEDEHSLPCQVFSGLARMLAARNRFLCFGRGDLKWLQADFKPDIATGSVLTFSRSYKEEKVIIVHNLSDTALRVSIPDVGNVALGPYGYRWIEAKGQL